MKLSESWLREWVAPDLDITTKADQLTMAGHEVDEISSEGLGLVGVVIAEVDPARVEEARAMVPALRHDRPLRSPKPASVGRASG